MEKRLQNFDVFGFRSNLLSWYQVNKRDLPWRNDQDPYKVWVSEIMLQQTKVDTVIPYFNRFITQFPTVYELANADQQEVLKAWEGLGYYSRARNLQHAVREVVASYGGEVPGNPKELGALKGIGPYTSGAILSIAFDQPEPAVDGNVMRVLSRVLYVKENITQQKVRKKFEWYVRQLISVEDPSSFNQGLMELGALICTPKAPKCSLCPVQEYCQAHAMGIEEQLPIKTKAKKQRKIPYIALLIKDKDGKYVIERRPPEGLLADLWQFPMVPLDHIKPDQIESWIQKEYGLIITLKKQKGELRHIFSHIIWELEIYEAVVTEVNSVDERLKFVERKELDLYPFPVSHLNMMEYLEG